MNSRYHATMHFHFDDVACAIPVKFTLREQLETALECANSMMRNAIRYNDGDMWARGWKKVKNIEEQLVIVDMIDFGYLKPAPGCGPGKVG